MVSVTVLAWPGVLLLGTLISGAIAVGALWRAPRRRWLIAGWVLLIGPWLPVFWLVADGVPDLFALIPALWLSPAVAFLLLVATLRRTLAPTMIA